MSARLLRGSLVASLLAGAALLIGTTPDGGARAQTLQPSYETIVEAREAFQRRDRDRLAAARARSAATRNPLAMWPDYWEMNLRIEELSVADVEAFYRRWPGSYVEDRFRNDWLLELGKRRDWPAFAADKPRFRMNDDRDVHCYALMIEQRQGRDVRNAARAAWLDQRDADEGCRTMAEALLAARHFGEDDVWLKLRHAIAAGRSGAARQAAGLISAEHAAAVDLLFDNPVIYLAKRASTRDRASSELTTLALMRAASKDIDYTSGALESRWDKVLPPDLAGWAWAALGRQAAFQLLPEAPAYYERGEYFAERALGQRDTTGAATAGWTDDAKTFRVRALLRQAGTSPRTDKPWQQILRTIAAMSPDEQQEPAWRYWKARALQVTALGGMDRSGNAADARLTLATQLLDGLAAEMHFYGALAAEDLGRTLRLPPAPAPLAAHERERALANPGLSRALQLIGIGLRSEGVREWNFTLRGMPERELLAAAQLACEREIWDRCINTSERTVAEVDMAQRFPTPFRDEVVAQARTTGVDPAYVYGLIRQESRFIMNARSHVGASGLMQLMPATARWTARKIGLSYSGDQIDNRATNLLLGTSYLKLVLDEGDGQQALGAAAYNAGPGRMRRWRDGPPIEPAVWAESIPFSETRDYVKKVLSNAQYYAARLGTEVPTMRRRLGPPIGSRDPSLPTRELP